jgi:O-acetyl-ADP-ribose deacetylase (regulator of RNase III)
METQLHYLIGDATDPIHKPAIIAHVCNSIGGWGRGFVLALSAKSKEPEKAYRKWYLEDKGSFVLGAVQLVPFDAELMVANMIAQEGIQWNGKIPPIRYNALEECLGHVYNHAKELGLMVVMPRIGAVLSGGDWPTIEAIIKKTMTVETYVYTLESQKDRWPTVYEY